MVDVSVTDAAQRDGVRLALARGSGPIGRLAHRFRRSAAGRALGATTDEAAAVAGKRAAAGAGLPSAAVLVEELIGDISFEAGGAFGEHLRQEFSPQRVEGELEAAADTVRTRHRSGPQVVRSRWWPVAAVIQTLILLLLIGAGVWAWAQPEVLRPGNWPWPVIAALLAVMVGLLVAALVRSSGRRAGQRAADLYRVRGESRPRRGDRPAPRAAAAPDRPRPCRTGRHARRARAGNREGGGEVPVVGLELTLWVSDPEPRTQYPEPDCFRLSGPSAVCRLPSRLAQTTSRR